MNAFAIAQHLFRAPAHDRYRCEVSSAVPAKVTSGLPQPGGSQLEIHVVGTTLTLTGELDLSTRDLVEQAGHEVLRRGIVSPSRDAVIDASGLRFIDACGLGALVSLSNSLAAAGVGMRITSASRQLRRLTGLCQLDTALGLATNPSAARAIRRVPPGDNAGPVDRDPTQ